MSSIRIVIGVILIFIILVGTNCFYTVSEGERALVLRLGKIVEDESGEPQVIHPGLHFKLPLVDQVRNFDVRVQELATLSDKPLTVVTKEQTNLIVEYFAKWKITDLAKFYMRADHGNVAWAENLLSVQIDGIVRNEYGKRTSDEAISSGRAAMVASIGEQANQAGKEQGVGVIDVQIREVLLPKDVLDSVFKRMATERQQFAEAKRAKGQEKAEEIKAYADQQVAVIKAEAAKQAAAIRAQGEQEAANIYSVAYGQHPQFYRLYQTLEAYKNSFSQKGDVLVLKPEGQFFQFFHSIPTSHDTSLIKKQAVS